MNDENRNRNIKDLIEERRDLRKNGTSAEALLWLSLKNRQINGVRWRRQFSVGRFILDFYCPECKLGIELDGMQHYSIDGSDYDDFRSRWLEANHGIRIIRFENRDIFTDYENIVAYIGEVVEEILDKK